MYRSEEGAFTGESWIHHQPRMSQAPSSPTLCLTHLPASASYHLTRKVSVWFLALPGPCSWEGKQGRREVLPCGSLPRPRLVKKEEQQNGVPGLGGGQAVPV